MVLQLQVKDDDAVLARTRSAGTAVVFPLVEFCGERMGRLRDPFGHVRLVSQRLEEHSSEEIKRQEGLVGGSGTATEDRMTVAKRAVIVQGSAGMDGAMARTRRKAGFGLAQLALVIGLLLFTPAGTLRFVEGWVFLAVFFGASLAITVYLAKADPALLERRTQGGPVAEKERSQKIIQGVASIAFLATIVVPALDHRCHWSHAPLPAIIVGDTLVAVGFLIVFLVFRENTFTSSLIEVAAEQRVVDTGLYAVVRHPMYLGGLVLIAGVPLALGSLVGLATIVPFAGVIVWRLLDEEPFLVSHLAGYAAYRDKVRFRLIPHIW